MALAEGDGVNKGLYTSARSDWETPAQLFTELDAEFHFDVDLCADDHNAKVKTALKVHDLWSALAHQWHGTGWLNPPYGRQIGRWVAKAYESAQQGATVVCLLPSRTDTAWWHDYMMKADEIHFIRGRLKFSGAKWNAPFPSAIVVFRG